MRTGDAVTYVSADGSQVPATVIAVVGTGVSFYKELSLTVGADTVESVAHEYDKKEGEAYWRLGSPVAPVAPVEPLEPEPVVVEQEDATPSFKSTRNRNR